MNLKPDLVSVNKRLKALEALKSKLEKGADEQAKGQEGDEVATVPVNTLYENLDDSIEETAPPAPAQVAAQGGDPPVGSDLPWTERELLYLQHHDLLMILRESPEEIPVRVRERAERLAETRHLYSHGILWS